MKRAVRRVVTAAGILAGAALLAGCLGALWLRSELRGSLPRLQGTVQVPGLAAPVRIERDQRGVPFVRGANREDVARATGFLHGQERFFQMDLMRRQSAGELAALLGRGLVRRDMDVRIHRFRSLARTVWARALPEERALVLAYAQGVRAGLAALEEKPFEYLLLRVEPEPWAPEDTILVTLTMFLELQDEQGRGESALGLMYDLLPRPMADFLNPGGTAWDAPLEGGPLPVPPIPGQDVVDLRARPQRIRSRPPERDGRNGAAAASARRDAFTAEDSRGSNNWAVAGAHTADGAALLANDMHLGLSVPNTWYRLALAWPDPGRGGAVRRVVGVTLPGTPGVVAGSNGDVAWGFTNSYGDWSDLVVLEPAGEDSQSYRTPHGDRRIATFTERIAVRGEGDRTMRVPWTVWGPVIDQDHAGRRRALRWVAHDPHAVNLHLLALETARSLDEAIKSAQRSGIPAQNIVIADRQGRIGWTLCGVIPRRVGFDGRLPGSWADGSRRWEGWLAPEEVPRVVDPPSGRVWTANARVVGGEALARIGDGGYAHGARARQIRDGLLAIERASIRDMLGIQLDDRALFLERWRQVLLDLLTRQAVAADPARGEARRFVERWGGRAALDSVGYRIVRAFRIEVAKQLMAPLTATCSEAEPQFVYSSRQGEAPVWSLVEARPMHLLEPRFESWEGALLHAFDAALRELLEDGRPLAAHTWGDRNRILVQHPLSSAVPRLSRWIDMKVVEVPGADHMPRVQSGREGASERLIVSPGREESGVFHMPCGQSGHPLSPHYSDGHGAWARGEPTPLLPGPPIHVLVLSPAGSHLAPEP